MNLALAALLGFLALGAVGGMQANDVGGGGPVKSCPITAPDCSLTGP